MAKILSLTPVLALLMAQPAFACASCMGKADGKTGAAMTASMGLLLTLVFAVACLFVYFVYFLAKRDGLPLDEDPNLGLEATSSPHQ
ncbi:MAG TPA: hypothetical protein VNQ90_05380 [Chthoniobacteraceae bacterium]|nr:hypothetical protein [Chthoniobacteraceae bacterium]